MTTQQQNKINIESTFSGAQGQAHELAARTGIVQPNTSEEIKFGAEKMGTAVPSGKLNEIKENVQEKVQVLNETVKENLEEGRKKVIEATEAPGPLHELGARAGLVQPTMSEEIKFEAEKMGTAGPSATLNEMQEKGTQMWYQAQDYNEKVKDHVRWKGAKVWNQTQDKAEECKEKIQENVEIAKEKVKEMTPGPLHEAGARVGLVQPTMSEEIKFGAEKMGTAGPTAKFNEMQEKGTQVWTQTQDKAQDCMEKIQENFDLGVEKVKDVTPGPLHELGARVGLVQPTMAEEIKFGAEKMGTATSTSKLNEFGEIMKENVAIGVETAMEATETLKEKSAQLWRETQEKVQGLNVKVMENLEFGWQKMREATEPPRPLHELGARVGLVQPTMSEEIKFGAEKMGTAVSTTALNEFGTKVKETAAVGVETAKDVTETIKEKSAQLWTETQEKVQSLNESAKENLEFGRMKVIEATETPGPLHELGARVGLVQPTMSEEIKFGAERMGTAGPTATTKLNEIGIKVKETAAVGAKTAKDTTDTIKEKSAQLWTETQGKVQEVNEMVMENLEVGCSGPLHELGARVGLVQPTTSEEIKFVAERMGTAGPTAEFNEWKESVKEKNEQIWTNVELGKEKMTEITPGPIHELGARAGLLQPTMSEEIKFGAEKMGTAGPTAKLNEMQEKGAQVWTQAQDKAQEYNEKIQENVEIAKEKVKGMAEAPGPLHEAGARVGLVQPTMSEEIKFGAEKMGTAGPSAKLREIGVKTKENVDVCIGKMTI